MVTSGFLMYFEQAAQRHCANSIYVHSHRALLTTKNPYANMFAAQEICGCHSAAAECSLRNGNPHL
jgi:hypothetical protein